MFETLRHDIRRYSTAGRWYANAGFWIVANYRFGTWAHSLRNPFFRLFFWALYRLLRLPLSIYNVHLWAGAGGARIGPGLVLIHPHNIMIGSGVEIGEDCLILHDVTLGTGQTLGTPKIGNNVDVYVGARILGGVVVGDRSIVGANSVVTRDIPPDCVMLAAPGRVLPRALSPVARRAEEQGTSKIDALS
jgi:serine O-acetyltransferase